MQSAPKSGSAIERLIFSRTTRIESIEFTMRTGSWVVGSARGTGCMAQRYAKTRLPDLSSCRNNPPSASPSPTVRCDLPPGGSFNALCRLKESAQFYSSARSLSPRGHWTLPYTPLRKHCGPLHRTHRLQRTWNHSTLRRLLQATSAPHSLRNEQPAGQPSAAQLWLWWWG